MGKRYMIIAFPSFVLSRVPMVSKNGQPAAIKCSVTVFERTYGRFLTLYTETTRILQLLYYAGRYSSLDYCSQYDEINNIRLSLLYPFDI